MAWLLLVPLILPFVLVRYDYGAARIALLAIWLACTGAGSWFLIQADKAQKDLVAVHPYPLPDTPGTHRVVISPLSQKSMKAVLTGGSGVLSPADLKKFGWTFLEPFVTATWFEPKQYDEPGTGETLLFYVDWSVFDGPLTLDYKVEPGTIELLRGRSLVVSHDGSARHMIAGHLLPSLYIFGWGLLIFGGGWMIAQIAVEAARRRERASVHAGSDRL